MHRLHLETSCYQDWQARLADPEKQWKRKYSAFENAVLWESAGKKNRTSGLPDPVEKILVTSGLCDPILLFAVGEHKVDLPGGNRASQSDVWAIVKSKESLISIAFEAKANETFDTKTLSEWKSQKSDSSINNRQERWAYIEKHLPAAISTYENVYYQLLHRCASAVIEAKRIGCTHAAFIVLSFESPDKSFQQYASFCSAIGIPSGRDTIAKTKVGDVTLAVGWAECPFASDEDIQHLEK